MNNLDNAVIKLAENHEKWLKLYNKNNNICNCMGCKVHSPPGDISKFIKKQNMCKLHNYMKKQIKHIINENILKENNMQWVFDSSDLPMTLGNLGYFIINEYEKENITYFNQYKELVNNLHFYK